MNLPLPLIIVWLSLTLSAPLAFLAVWAVTEKTSDGRRLLKQFLWACGVVVVVVLFILFIRIRFTNVYANIFVFSLTYLAYCYVAIFCWKIKSTLLRFISVFITHISILLGYALATIGLLGLMLIVNDITQPPKTMQMTSNLTCEVSGWGWAGSDSGYAVNLYKQWPLLPFIEKKVYSVSINESQNASDGEGDDCPSAFVAYQNKQLK